LASQKIAARMLITGPLPLAQDFLIVFMLLVLVSKVMTVLVTHPLYLSHILEKKVGTPYSNCRTSWDRSTWRTCI